MDWNSKRWPNFTQAELACKCGCNKCEMDPLFMDALTELRSVCSIPFHISSGYRCSSHNAKVSHTGSMGPHTKGRAVDIATDGRQAHLIITNALAIGFMGIGVSIKDGKGFLHIDTITDEPRPNIWSY